MVDRTNQRDANAANILMLRKRREAVTVLTGNIADNFPVPADATPVLVLGASAARDILLPANAEENDGLIFTFISNSSTTTGVLTFKTSADAALSPAVTLVQNAMKSFIYIHAVPGWKQYS